MAGPSEKLVPQISNAFLRGLEADLRGLCADARKRNPDVKEQAERVILSLKEADTQQSEADAADKAAAVFCSACQPSDLTAGSSALSTQVKVALRAASSLHKLLIHRAVYPARLPDVLSALERLSDPCVDDNVTLKVLQGILSVLTIRGYAKALTEDETLRAFSLLFTVKTSRPANSGHPASAAFSAVAVGSSGNEVGVIEQTAKAAFRQVTSDLFASAADAAVQTAVERKAPSSEFIAVALFPVEVRAAFSLFMDLINAASGESLEWIPSSASPSRSTSTLLDIPLAIEVLDDNLASNIALFAGQPVFSEVLAARLCPVIHRLLKTISERVALRSLLSLVVSVIRHYWRTLQPDTEALLYGLSRMSLELVPEDRNDDGWVSVYSIEALRCIFRREVNETNRVLDLVKAFDLRDGSGSCVGEAVQAACHLMNRWKTGMIEHVPSAALIGELKPFLNTIKPTDAFRAAIAASLYGQIVDSAWEAVAAKDFEVSRVLMSAGTLELPIRAIERMTDDIFSQGLASWHGERNNGSMSAYNALISYLERTAKICDAVSLEFEKALALSTLAAICSKCVAGDSLDSSQQKHQIEAADLAFSALLEVTLYCKESLERSWLPILRAIERLDGYTYSREKLLRAELLHGSTAFDVLTSKVQSISGLPTTLSWKACHDMITAFVQCSRQAVTHISKNEDSEDLKPAAPIGPNFEIFGMKCAESAFLKAIHRNPAYKGPEPSSLWQLLSSHLTSVCLDSSQSSLRLLALRTLTHLVCGIISSSEGMIPHNVVVAPFLDLLASSYADVSTGCITSVYVLLTTQGERLSDASAWHTVLQMLSIAGGSKLPTFSSDDYGSGFEEVKTMNGAPQGVELVSEGFKVVQVIASDFLASLSHELLLLWLALLRVYCFQVEDVNVALTAVGLLWRTADFLAKPSRASSTEATWIGLVVALKDISLDDRPEVRKCAIKTLMGALSTHACKISPDVWNRCLQFALIPLLECVLRGGASASVEEPVTPKVSSKVPLLLHHSRDTPRKQWNETRVLALGGVAEVLRVSLPYMTRGEAGSPSSSQQADNDMTPLCWNDLLKTTCVAACSRDTEVAVAGVSAILDYLHSVALSCHDCVPDFSNWLSPKESMLTEHRPSRRAARNDGGNSHGTDIRDKGTNVEVAIEQVHEESDSESAVLLIWNNVWSTLESLFESDGAQESLPADKDEHQRPLTLVNQKAVLLLAEGLLTAWRELRKKFSSRSSKILASILIKLSFLSSKNIRIEFQTPEDRTHLEEMAIAGLEDVATTGNAACRYCITCEVLHALSALRESADMPPQKQAARAIRMVKLIFEQEETPIDMRLSLIPRVISALKPIIVSHESQAESSISRVLQVDDSSVSRIGESPLWATALDVLISVMRSVPADRFSDEHVALWIPYLTIVEEFVYSGANRATHTRAVIDSGKNESFGRKRETYAILLTSNAMKLLTCVRSESSTEPKRFLLRLLTRGAEEGVTSGRPRFVHACQKILFSTVDGDHSSKEPTFSMASEAADFIMRMCDRALHRFITDDQRAGRCPLPAKRREEIVFLLRQLVLLNRKSSAARNHVVALYPRLCECVESRDEALRALARELLDEAAPRSKAERQANIHNARVEVK